MSLKEYQRKRDFKRTPEPTGKAAKRQGFTFVVQKHDARNLHYDFRLEWEGVLKSWAVPKGPCLDSTVKRLAVQVEDHPIEYGSFEGVIPQGEYGGGTVLLWDQGTWEPSGDAQEGFRTGRLKFRLQGSKLQGAWMLLRTGKNTQYGSGKPQWLLFKERDEFAQSLQKDDILETLPLSVQTGRSLLQIAAQRDAVWSSKSPPQTSTKKTKVTPLETPRELLVRMVKYDDKQQSLAGARLTSPEKVLYPESNINKLELAAYYQMVSKWMLPHLRHRPVVLVRCPEGRHRECFYQKHPAIGSPHALRQIAVQESKQTSNYFVVDDVKGLISLAQIAALEVHVWGSREDKLDFPDRMVFDLDPDPTVPWQRVVEAARQVRGLLKELDLESFVKLTGGKGLHLVVPIERRHYWEEVKSFCRTVAEVIVKFDPHHYTANMSKAQRQGKIYIDYLRNTREATAIVAYSPRMLPGASVSVPLTWAELGGIEGPGQFTIRNIGKRMSKLKHDPWSEIKSLRQTLSKPLRTLNRVLKG